MLWWCQESAAPFSNKRDRHCKDCRTLVAAAYPHMTIDSVALRVEEPEFAASFKAALDVFLGLKRGNFLREQFTRSSACRLK